MERWRKESEWQCSSSGSISDPNGRQPLVPADEHNSMKIRSMTGQKLESG